MSPQNASLGKVIDPFRFAAEARTQSGEVEVAKLPRLKDSLADVNAVLSWRLEGWLESSVLSGREVPRLKLLIDGALSLRCQRCLNGIDWQLAIATVLQPVRAGQQIPDEDKCVAVGSEHGYCVNPLISCGSSLDCDLPTPNLGQYDINCVAQQCSLGCENNTPCPQGMTCVGSTCAWPR